MKRIDIYGFCVLLVFLFALDAAPVRAQQNTVEYQCLGLPQYFSVPPGVTQITTVVVGSGGESDDSAKGNAAGGGKGGRGAKITATVNVTPGQLLKLDIACAAVNSGFPLGGSGENSGGAGSAISVGDTVLVVAGGGGGAGASGTFEGTTNGGAGGDAIAGGNGTDGQGLINPGRGGAFAAAGTAQGGDGEYARFSGGGGGGGGGYDGMGGGGGAGGTASGNNGTIAGSGGGGGGRSYVNSSFTSNVSNGLADTITDGSMTISYNGQTIPNQVYQCTGSSQVYTVPAGVRTLSVIGIGGDGGSIIGTSTVSNGGNTNSRTVGGSGIASGKSANVSVTPGELLSIGVGCNGGLPAYGGVDSPINPGGGSGFGFISGGRGGDGDKPYFTVGAGGGVGGGGATGIGRDSSPLFVAAGGGGGGGQGGFDYGCNAGFGGAADGYNGDDASPCANKGMGGATGGGGSLDGGNGCSYCSSGGGGGAGGGYPSGTGGTAGGIGEAGGGGGGGGKSFAGISTQNFQTVDTDAYRKVKGLDSFSTVRNPTNGILIITPIFNALTPPVVTPKIIPGVPNGANGWYRSNVNVSWQVNSSGSPLSDQTECASTILSTDTTGITYQCSATNAFGITSGSTVQIKRDATAPTLAATAVKQDGTPYTFGTTTNQAVNVTFTCSDATSGVVSCPAARTYGASSPVIASVADNAGNLTTTNFGSVVNNNQPPTLSDFADVTVPINTPSRDIQFTIGDDTTAPQSLVVTAVSSNQALVPNGNISLPVAPQQGANRDLFITPANNKVGTTIITVTVRDQAGATTSKIFTVAVNCANLQINRTSSPTVPFGDYFSDTVFASGGVAPYTFRRLSGTLPTGLESNQDGTTISGNPLRLGTYTLAYEATDSTGCRAVAPVAITVSCLTNYTVSNNNDNDFGTLRFAVAGACPNSVIDFNQSVSEILINGKLNVNSLLIRGPGANKVTIRNAATDGGNNRVFETSGTSEISGLTVTGGSAPTSFGGGIRQNNGNLTVRDSVVNNNFAAYGGGGIFSDAGTMLTVLNSTISNNTGADNLIQGNSGGGIKSRGEVRIVNSTISGNTVEGSDSAGGVYAARGLISNSTVTNNKVNNVFNPVNSASGVYGGSNPDRLTVRSSIIAGNQGNTTFPDVVNLFTSGGYNLIGNRGSAAAFNQTGDQTGTSAAPLNPLLDILKLNGGTTPTHSFVSTSSPAVDKGNSFGLTTDQLGQARPFDNPMIFNAPGGDGADIGAFEMPMAPTAAGVSISGRTLTTNGRGIRNVRVTLTDARGNLRTAVSNTFGYYRFAEVAAGETYIVTANGKRYSFSQATQIVNANQDAVEINFIANPI